MGDGCQGYGTLETEQCRECHAEGGTWVHHPDGSYGCTYTFTRSEYKSNKVQTALLAGILIGLVVWSTQLDT